MPNPVSESPGDRSPRLADVLRALPQRELSALVARLAIPVDDSKRIDVPEQVARALVLSPALREVAALPTATVHLLHRIAEARGVLVLPALPPVVEPLVARGLVFVRAGSAGGVELILPAAHLLNLPPWEGEDPRGFRALLAQTSPDVAASIAGNYLGRTATPPIPIALEVAWESLSDPAFLRADVDSLPPPERKLLAAIEKVGGEVDTEELLDLEREPMRLRGPSGATLSRRGVGFALERRGYLVPIHPNRHVVPTEIIDIIGARAAADRDHRRKEVVAFVLSEDHAPRRARFASDPAPLALAMAMAMREVGAEVREDLGTPRSLTAKLASRFGRAPEEVAVLAALSRAVGLWDASAISVTSPPGAHAVADVSALLFRAWRRGGAWDEARADGETLRVPQEQREASAARVVRDVVIEALCELGEGRWVPWEAVAGYVRTDARTPGVARLIERWAQRAGLEAPPVVEIARRIVLDTFHTLGVVDLGDIDDDEGAFGPTLRLTPRGRALLGLGELALDDEPSRFLDHQTLRLSRETRIGHVLALTPFVEIGGVGAHLDVVVNHSSLARALGTGIEPQVVRGRLVAIAALPDPVERSLAQASAILGRAEFVPTGGFLWVEDPEVRELLRTRRQTSDLFVDPSPPAGLLIASGVDLERLARRCRALGVEVVVEGDVYRTHSQPPRSRSSGSLPAVPNSSRPASGTRQVSRRSSASMRAQKRGGSGT